MALGTLQLGQVCIPHLWSMCKNTELDWTEYWARDKVQPTLMASLTISSISSSDSGSPMLVNTLGNAGYWNLVVRGKNKHFKQ